MVEPTDSRKRFGKYGLALHPDKTRLVPFHRPDRADGGDDGPGTFDSLGFTHHWCLSRKEALHPLPPPRIVHRYGT